MNKMKEKEILSALCYYDPRNPNVEADFDKPDRCSCDNCFYGHDSWANELLKTRAVLKEALQEHYDYEAGKRVFSEWVTKAEEILK